MRDVIRRAVIVGALVSAAVFGGLAWQADRQVTADAPLRERYADLYGTEMIECGRGESDCSMFKHYERELDGLNRSIADNREARDLYAGLAWQAPLSLVLAWLLGTWIATGRLRHKAA